MTFIITKEISSILLFKFFGKYFFNKNNIILNISFKDLYGNRYSATACKFTIICSSDWLNIWYDNIDKIKSNKFVQLLIGTCFKYIGFSKDVLKSFINSIFSSIEAKLNNCSFRTQKFFEKFHIFLSISHILNILKNGFFGGWMTIFF